MVKTSASNASSSHDVSHFNVIVVGGGLVGASAAVALAQQGFRVALVDQAMPSPEINHEDSLDGWDNRIYALSPGNVDWLKQLGAWNNLDRQRVCPIERMEIFGDDGS